MDTNIILDLLQKREEFYLEAQELFTLADKREVNLYVSALSIANIHFTLFKYLKFEDRKVVSILKVLVKVLPIDHKIIELSLALDFNDFENAIQYYTAMENNMDVILTRNKRDFKNLEIPVLTAKEFLRSR